MKTPFPCCLALIIYATCLAAPNPSAAQFTSTWDHAVDPSSADDDANAITVDPTGVFIAGFDAVNGDKRLRIEKRELATGMPVLNFGQSGVVNVDPTPSDDVANGIVTDATGVYVTGSEMICLGCDTKWYIEKRDAVNGGLVWSQNSNPSINPDGSNAIAIDATGVYICGTVGISFFNWAWRVEKRTLNTGALIWGHTLDVSNLGDTPYSIAVDATGVYTVGFEYSTGNQAWRIEKRDLATGTVLWAQVSDPGTADDFATAVATHPSGILVAGADLSGPSAQWRIEKRDTASGALIPSFGTGGVVVSDPSSGPDEPWAMTIDHNEVFVSGFDDLPGNRQWRIEKRDPFTGGVACSTSVNPGTGEDRALAVAADTSGVYVAGTDVISANNEWRMEKFDRCPVTVSVVPVSPDAALATRQDGSSLILLHPNMNEGTVVLYGPAGRRAMQASLGSGETIIRTSGLPTGIYLLQIRSAGRVYNHMVAIARH